MKNSRHLSQSELTKPVEESGIKHLLISAASIILFLAAPSFAQTDLEEYIVERRAAGMSEAAESAVQTVAGILSGATVFTVNRNPDGSYGRSYFAALCFRPGADSEEMKRLRGQINRKKEHELQRLQQLADLDGSGFVSTDEGRHVRELVEFGFQMDQMEPEDRETVEKAAKSLGREVTWVKSAAVDYRRLAMELNASEGAKLPQVTLMESE
jgi:hypothetical protein